MRSPLAQQDLHSSPAPRPVVAVGVLTALWCVGFAVVNVVFELTDHLDDGAYAEYAAGFTVMNWFVVVLKLVGAAVALLTVASRPRWPSPSVLAVLVWGAFATIGVYAVGSAVQAIGLATGLLGDPDVVDAAGVAYVLFFLAAAAGYGVLAVSYARRHRTRRATVVLGILGAPAMLALLLVAGPALLAALGVMPSVL
jgi:hypothetical protein